MSEEIIDSKAIERLRRLGGDKLVSRMVGVFVPFGESQMDQIRTGLGSGDLIQVERAAHALKSSAGNFGAGPLYGLAESAEQWAAEGRLADLQRMMDDLERAFSRVKAYLLSIG